MNRREAILTNARAMRREPTPAERKLWSLLRGGQIGGLKFRRQVPIGDYIADFACFYPRVIVECDGGQHADNPYDQARDRWLRSRGFTIIRVWNGEIAENPESVTDRIRAIIGRG